MGLTVGRENSDAGDASDSASDGGGGRCGGFGGGRPADANVIKLAKQLRGEVLKEAKESGFEGSKFQAYEPICHRSQVVAGVNYKIKIRIGKGQTDYIHVRISKSLELYRDPWVTEVVLGQTRDAALE